MFKAVVFDMDGILFDTERISVESFFQTAKEMGLSIPDHAVYGLLGLNAAAGHAFFTSEMEKIYPGTFPYEAFTQKNREIHAAIMAKGVPLMKGVKEILSFLKEKGIKTAVASSTAQERVRKNLEEHQLTGYFDAIITGDMVERSKPEPDIFQKACEALGVECQKAVAVEDSPNGIRAAHAAEMFTVMVPDMMPPTEELRQLSDLICDDLLVLKGYLEDVLK